MFRHILNKKIQEGAAGPSMGISTHPFSIHIRDGFKSAKAIDFGAAQRATWEICADRETLSGHIVNNNHVRLTCVSLHGCENANHCVPNGSNGIF